MKPLLGRVLAVDPGEVRIGLAVCDPMGIALSPLGVVEGGPGAAGRVAAAVRSQNADAVAVGLPLNMDGSAGKEARKAAALGRRLAALLGSDIPVYMQDERLTSYEAETLLSKADHKPSRNKARIDTLSAQLILKAFVDDWRSGKEFKAVQPDDQAE